MQSRRVYFLASQAAYDFTMLGAACWRMDEEGKRRRRDLIAQLLNQKERGREAEETRETAGSNATAAAAAYLAVPLCPKSPAGYARRYTAFKAHIWLPI